jgi:ADP-heptose:LPS heptosyltransferase
VVNLAGTKSLLTLAALARDARLVVSCDTGIVHLAAAFETPQVALYGPTNPFHWRPRHPRAIVLSAANPEAPLTTFEPRAKGAPMDLLSTALVIHATDSLLASSTLLS